MATNPADPFSRFGTHQELPVEEKSDFILIKCKECSEDCLKNHHGEWVHAWEINKSDTVFHQNHHRAQPNIIDVEVVDD